MSVIFEGVEIPTACCFADGEHCRFYNVCKQRETVKINYKPSDCPVKALEQEPKWIPVSEELPEDGTYLVTRHFYDCYETVIRSFDNDLYSVDSFDFIDKKGVCGWYDYDIEYGYYEDMGVVAWMPLPEPYKGGSEG